MSGDAAAPAPSPPVRPLEGLTVVSIEQYGAAPFGTMYLADLGADVIKIENHKAGGEMGPPRPALCRGRRQPLLPDLQLQQALYRLGPQEAARTGDPGEAGWARRRAHQQPAGRPAGQPRARLCEPRPGQPAPRLRAPLGLRPRQRARRLARPRLRDAGGGRLPLHDRGAGQRPHPLRPLRRRLHGRAHRCARSGFRRHARARQRPGHGYRHAPLRRGDEQPELPRHLAPQRGLRAEARRPLRPPPRWCRASSTAPPTAGSSSWPTRRTSGPRSAVPWSGRNGSTIP